MLCGPGYKYQHLRFLPPTKHIWTNTKKQHLNTAKRHQLHANSSELNANIIVALYYTHNKIDRYTLLIRSWENWAGLGPDRCQQSQKNTTQKVKTRQMRDQNRRRCLVKKYHKWRKELRLRLIKIFRLWSIYHDNLDKLSTGKYRPSETCWQSDPSTLLTIYQDVEKHKLHLGYQR